MVQQAIEPHEDLLTTVKRSNLQWYSHVSRSSGLAKTILRGTVNRDRRQGRQRKTWEDIREWIGLEFGKSQRAVENKEKWRKLVAKSSVVPKWPSRLRDRWDDERANWFRHYLFPSREGWNSKAPLSVSWKCWNYCAWFSRPQIIQPFVFVKS